LILALAGGVGGAKLAHGLSMLLAPDRLQIVVNTGDDFDHLGLHVSPDLDTVMYWLAEVSDRERGWGLVDESWNFMAALGRLGGPAWFKLGDRDLATHVHRTSLLRSGMTLSDVTRALCRELGVRHPIAPMSDGKVRTIVETEEGALEFQDYFVRRQCKPRVLQVEYRGASEATMSAPFAAALERDDLEAIIICPSNPILSIDPILSVGHVRARLKKCRAAIVAVSPIIGGKALKGPAAKILQELGRAPSSLEIARHYAGLIDGLVIDHDDASLAKDIEALGLRVEITNTIMTDRAEQSRLAEATISFAKQLRE
jgi:LPPG:FO 2-phospho-L-lactate transferase